MTARPNPTTFFASGAVRTEGEVREDFFEPLDAAIGQMPGGAAATTLTIASGSVTPVGAEHAIDTESAASTDDLTNIATTELPDGSWLLLRAANAARTVVVKHNAGGAGGIHLATGADMSLDDTEDFVVLRRGGADWYEIGRGYASAADWRTFLGLGALATLATVGTSQIDNDAVTFAKIQNVTTDRLLGRDTASSGDTEEISVGGGLEFTGSAGIRRSALTGDVTASAGSNATTIANDAVTFAKMQNIATDTLVGRDTASTGDPEAISVGGGLEFTGSGGIQRSALTGDVTASAGSNATTVVSATTTTAGKVELATDAEAQALTDTARALTPSNLAAVTATTTRTGIAELATDAEAIAKSDTARTLTPSNLAALGASATFAGLIEIATDAEALAKTDTVRALVPSNLAAIGATATFAGLVELATTAEAQAGTDTARAVTPEGLRSATREKLTGSRTYYVRTDGSDSNTGLANTSGGAFLTIQAALNAVGALDLGGQSVTIQVGAGTYTAGAFRKGAWVGGYDVSLVGDTTTPANVIWSVTGGTCLAVQDFAYLRIRGFEIRTTTSGYGLIANNLGHLLIDGNMRFGACADSHMQAAAFGFIEITSSYTISGGASNHWWAHALALLSISNSPTITLSGTPAFGGRFAYASHGGRVGASGITFSGSATGQRFLAENGGIINSGGGGASYFPGNSAGSGSNYGASPYGLYV